MRLFIIPLFVLSLTLTIFTSPPIALASHCPAGSIHNPDDATLCVASADSISCNNGAGTMVGGQCVTNGAGNSGGGTTLINPLSAGTNLESFLNQILDFIIRIGTIAVILMLVYVGYLFVIARGAPGEIETAKKALMWTLVGALVLLGAKAISIALKATVAAVTG